MDVKESLDRFHFLSGVAVVGGAVRDDLLGRQSDDIDLATSDTPSVVKQKCSNRGIKTVDTGIDHGTVTAIVGGEDFEITTFRRDVSTDGRNATVEFADKIEEDLKRRDFTINAMAVEPGGRLVDPFGGIEDLIDGRIRAVGDPRERFREDYLRIIRALRFSARYDFDIGLNEQDAMEELSGRVADNVSVERVVMEIEKAMKSLGFRRFIGELLDLEILQDYIGRPVHNQGEIEDVAQVRRPEDRMALFVWRLKHCALAESFEEIQRALKLPSDTVKTAKGACNAVHLLSQPVTDDVRRKMLAEYRGYLDTAKRIGTEAFGLSEHKFESDVPLGPIASGQDFLDEGFEEGPQIGELVEKAHRIQLEEKITNKQTLIKKAQ
jgi:tRNA nucleotidyltransferase/poly(A) polymerase